MSCSWKIHTGRESPALGGHITVPCDLVDGYEDLVHTPVDFLLALGPYFLDILLVLCFRMFTLSNCMLGVYTFDFLHCLIRKNN